jgi:hypothetical protein
VLSFRIRSIRAIIPGISISADDRLSVTGLFDAAVSAPQNPVSRKQRPTVAETRSNGCSYMLQRSDEDRRQGVRAARRRGLRRHRRSTLSVPWQKSPARRRREILLPEGIRPEHARPIRSETRARLVAAIARGRRWLDELIADPTASPETIATRENCSTRKINMTISLTFLTPDLVKAAIEGRLPHGVGVARLTDLPAEWSRQHQMLGLPAR